MKHYAVRDSNVLVSALLKNGSMPWRAAKEALHGDIIPVLNDEILAEYKQVNILDELKKYVGKRKPN